MTQSEYSELATLLKLGIDITGFNKQISKTLTIKIKNLCEFPDMSNIEFLEKILGQRNNTA